MSLFEEFDFFMNNMNKLSFSELVVICKRYNIDCNNKTMKEVTELIKNYISRTCPEYIDYYILREQKKYLILNNRQRNQLFVLEIEQKMRSVIQKRLTTDMEEKLKKHNLEQSRNEKIRLEQERVRQQQLEQERVRQQQLEYERVRQQQLEYERARQLQFQQEVARQQYLQRIEEERVRQQLLQEERFRQQQLEQEKNVVLNEITVLLTNMCNSKNIIYVE
jgi:hypothetical protein